MWRKGICLSKNAPHIVSSKMSDGRIDYVWLEVMEPNVKTHLCFY